MAAKLKDAKFALKKSLRVDLYNVLACPRGELSSEKEIKTAYKKAALKWHPDRHSAAGKVAKDEAEKRFKEIGDAYELLLDSARRALYGELNKTHFCFFTCTCYRVIIIVQFCCIFSFIQQQAVFYSNNLVVQIFF